VNGQQRDQLARFTREHPLAADDMDGSGAELRVDLNVGVAIGGEQQQLSEQMVEPPGGTAEHENPLRPERERGVECKLEVGRVFRGRVSLQACARPLDHPERRLGDRVEVAEGDIDPQPEPERVLGAAIGGDHRRPRGEQDGHAQPGPAGDDNGRLHEG
jgi:hypothetical protein